jgi:hypothetical protein
MKRWADLPPDERPCADDIAAALVVAARHFQAAPKLHEALARQDLRVLPGRVRVAAAMVCFELFPDLTMAMLARLCSVTPSAIYQARDGQVKVVSKAVTPCLEAFLVLRP